MSPLSCGASFPWRLFTSPERTFLLGAEEDIIIGLRQAKETPTKLGAILMTEIAPPSIVV